MGFQKQFLQKLHKVLFIAVIGLNLISCESDGEVDQGESVKDTVPPSVSNFYPENDTQNFEIDSIIRLEFSELMNLESLISSSDALNGLQLNVSSTLDKDGVSETLPRAQKVEFSVKTGVGLDPVTSEEIDIDVTVANLTHASGRLALNTEYTVTVDPTSRDQNEDDPDTDEDERNFFDGLFTLVFKTEDGEWKEPETLQTIKASQNPENSNQLVPVEIDANQYDHVLMSNDNGNALLAWRQVNAGISEIWVSNYNPGNESWELSKPGDPICELDENLLLTEFCQNSLRVDVGVNSSAFGHQVAMNNSGHAVVVWHQDELNSGVTSIWANIFNGFSWLGAQKISHIEPSDVNGDSTSSSVAMDEVGNIVVVWRELDFSVETKADPDPDAAPGSTIDEDTENFKIKSNIFTADLDPDEDYLAGAWGTTSLYLDANDNYNDAYDPKVAVSADGYTIAVWIKVVDGQHQLLSNRFTIGSNNAWQDIKRVNATEVEASSHSLSQTKIQIDNNHNVFVIWLQNDGNTESVWVNRYAAESWGEATLFEQDQRGDADGVSLTVGRDNKAFAIWQQNEGADNSLKIRAYEEVWLDAVTISTGLIYTKPQVQFDREGNAMAVWQQGLLSGQVYSSRYVKINRLWGAPIPIDSGQASSDISLTTLLEDGRMLAVWTRFDGWKNHLVSALFSD